MFLMETEADCGGPEPARSSEPDTVYKTGHSSEPETDDTDDLKPENLSEG